MRAVSSQRWRATGGQGAPPAAAQAAVTSADRSARPTTQGDGRCGNRVGLTRERWLPMAPTRHQQLVTFPLGAIAAGSRPAGRAQPPFARLAPTRPRRTRCCQLPGHLRHETPAIVSGHSGRDRARTPDAGWPTRRASDGHQPVAGEMRRWRGPPSCPTAPSAPYTRVDSPRPLPAS